MNPLYQSFKQNQNGSILDAFGGQSGFQNAFNNFARNFMQQSTISPEEKVRQLISSGQMTQAQFEQLRAMANQITGMNL